MLSSFRNVEVMILSADIRLRSVRVLGCVSPCRRWLNEHNQFGSSFLLLPPFVRSVLQPPFERLLSMLTHKQMTNFSIFSSLNKKKHGDARSRSRNCQRHHRRCRCHTPKCMGAFIITVRDKYMFPCPFWFPSTQIQRKMNLNLNLNYRSKVNFSASLKSLAFD